MDEYNDQEKSLSSKEQMFYVAASTLSFLGIIGIVYISKAQGLFPLIVVSFLFILGFVFLMKTDKLLNTYGIDEEYNGFSPIISEKRKLDQIKNDIIEFISQEDVQRAILRFLEFNKFNQLNDSLIMELKKHLALKEYIKAFIHLISMLNVLAEMDEQKSQEEHTKKIIEEYELNLNYKI